MTKRPRHRAGAKDTPPQTDAEIRRADVPRTVTTLALPTDIWTQLKIRSAQERVALRDICQRAIVAYLATPLERA